MFFGCFYLAGQLPQFGVAQIVSKSIQSFGGFFLILVSIGMHFHPGYKFNKITKEKLGTGRAQGSEKTK